jgi:hypothetical protein
VRLTRRGGVDFVTRVGPKVQSVLGLSMTSTSVGWVLLAGQGPDAATLDHDSFDVQSAADGAAGDTSPHEAAARGAQAIATASGHKVGSVQVTWTEDVEAAATVFLKSLADLGFDNVHAVPLSKAAQAWGIEVGRETEHTKTGLCILEPDEAMIMVVATGAGSVRTAITDTRETPQDLVEWLRTVFRKDGWLPESLYLVGALADLDEVTQPIADALPIPVSDSVDNQHALARGAALANADQVINGSAKTAERPWRMSVPKKSAAAAAAETVVAPVVCEVDALATQAIETPRDEPRNDPRSDRPWLVSHTKKLTISAAAVAVFGAALSLTAGSALSVENASMQAADPSASGAPMTSAGVHTVPAPAPAALPSPLAQPRAAEPPPAPPETLVLRPLVVVAPEPVAAPVPRPTVSASPPANVSAATPTVDSPVAPLAMPHVASPAAPDAAPVFGPPPGPDAAPVFGPPPGPVAAPVFGPPPGPVAAPVFGPPPGPVAAPAIAPPAAPLPAPTVASPAAPVVAPPAAGPMPPEPADGPPPPDPIGADMSPLFSGLP